MSPGVIVALFVAGILLVTLLVVVDGDRIDRKYARKRRDPAEELPLDGRAAALHRAIVDGLPGRPTDDLDLVIRAMSKAAVEHLKPVDVPPPPPPMRPS